jgi:hypothetical protein
VTETITDDAFEQALLDDLYTNLKVAQKFHDAGDSAAAKEPGDRFYAILGQLAERHGFPPDHGFVVQSALIDTSPDGSKPTLAALRAAIAGRRLPAEDAAT